MEPEDGYGRRNPAPPGSAARSPDDLIRALQERRRDRQAEGLGGLEVDHQLELGGLLDREVCRPGAPEYLVDVDRRAANDVVDVRTVGEERTALCPGPPAG